MKEQTSFLQNFSKTTKKSPSGNFFFYDDNGFLIKEIIDDGSRESSDDLAGVSERLIKEYTARTSFPFGLAEEVALKAYHAGRETLLKRFRNTIPKKGGSLKPTSTMPMTNTSTPKSSAITAPAKSFTKKTLQAPSPNTPTISIITGSNKKALFPATANLQIRFFKPPRQRKRDLRWHHSRQKLPL